MRRKMWLSQALDQEIAKSGDCGSHGWGYSQERPSPLLLLNTYCVPDTPLGALHPPFHLLRALGGRDYCLHFMVKERKA